MSWIHMAWASKQTAGSGTNKLVLLMLADATSHDNPVLVIKMDRMMHLCELSERAIRNAIKDLEERNLVGVVERYFEGHRAANGYFLMNPEWMDQVKSKVTSESHRDGFTCRLREVQHDQPARDAGIDRHEMPDMGAPDAGQIQPSSFLPSSNIPSFVRTAQSNDIEEQENHIPSQLVASVAVAAGDSLPLLEAEQESCSNRPDGTVTGKKNRAPKENLSAEPSEAEWVAYCTERYPDWPEARVRALWAYHGSRGWMIGRQKMKNWKLVAATGYSKAKEFGHLVVVKNTQTSRVAKLGYEED